MSTSLRRKLAALRNLTEDRGATPGEAAAAQAAIQRLLGRLGESVERLVDREPPYVPPRQKRARRDRRPHPGHRLHMGDIVDRDRWCRCGSNRFEVVDAIALGHVAMWVCIGCGRGGGWLERRDFEVGGRHLRD